MKKNLSQGTEKLIKIFYGTTVVLFFLAAYVGKMDLTTFISVTSILLLTYIFFAEILPRIL